MTRRTKVFLCTWLLSAGLSIPAFQALSISWALLMTKPAFDMEKPDSLREVAVYLYASGNLIVCSLAAAPVVFLCWRAVNKFVPDDEEE